MSDMVQFQHKDITNPTVTHADKLINAIATCINAIRGLGNGKNESNISNLNQLLEATSRIVKRNEDKATEEATDPSSTNLTEERETETRTMTKSPTHPAKTRTSTQHLPTRSGG